MHGGNVLKTVFPIDIFIRSTVIFVGCRNLIFQTYSGKFSALKGTK